MLFMKKLVKSVKLSFNLSDLRMGWGFYIFWDLSELVDRIELSEGLFIVGSLRSFKL